MDAIAVNDAEHDSLIRITAGGVITLGRDVVGAWLPDGRGVTLSSPHTDMQTHVTPQSYVGLLGRGGRLLPHVRRLLDGSEFEQLPSVR